MEPETTRMARANSLFPRIVLTALAAMLCCSPGSAPAAGQARTPASAAADAGAVLKQYCVTCHNDRLKTADLALNQLDPAKVQENPAIWEQVVRKLRTGTMPPPGSPRPGQAGYDLTAGWLESELNRTAQPNPGRPALR